MECSKIKIIKAQRKDIPAISQIASLCFRGMKDIKKATKWITCNFNAFPRMQYFLAKTKDNFVIGYILWKEKGGFREQAVIELEQIAVHSECQKNKIGTKLISQSLPEIKKQLKKRGSQLKIIEISTGNENEAQKLYKNVLGAKVEAELKNFYRGDEVIMLRRFL